MRRASGAGETPNLPANLQSDHDAFVAAIRPWLESRPHGARELALLTRYGALVHDQSGRISLIAQADRSSIYTRHVLDSLNPVALFQTPPSSALDLGSGAGFPGIPLAIVWPECQIVLVESREKKAGFLERVARELGLRNVAVACVRIEDLVAANTSGLPAHATFIRALGDLPSMLTSLRGACVPGAPWVYFLGGGLRGEETLAQLASAGLRSSRVTGQFGGGLLRGTV